MFTVSLSGILLLFLIHHSTLDRQNINRNTLARIIAFFEQNYKRVDENTNERQYAVAINVLTDQCKAGFQPSQDNFLTNESAEDVRWDIANAQYPVYEGTELIAAGVERRRLYTIHSERLLLNPTEERLITPMQILLMRRRNSCTVLYTLYSPCADVCLNRTNNYNILRGLQTWSVHGSIKALVFKHIWRHDTTRREVLQNALRNITRYVPLFRCINDNLCYACGGPNVNTIDDHCLS